MAEKEATTNVTFTLPQSIVDWLDGKVISDDSNRSRVARNIFRNARAAESEK